MYPLLRDHHRRVIFTGMGASHIAALRSWRRLVAAGEAAWWIDTKNLLEHPQLLTSDSMLVVTSRSGCSPQVGTLAEELGRTAVPHAVIAITDDMASPLVAVSDCEVLLRSGASASPTGFLNALIAHDYVASMILNEDNDDVADIARVVATTTLPKELRAVAASVAAQQDSRLAYVGFDQHATVALYAALLTNDATGVDAQGHIAQRELPALVRHADSQLTAVLFASSHPCDAAMSALADDLLAAESNVVVVGGAAVPGAIQIPSPPAHALAEVARDVVVIEQFVSQLASQRAASA
ncbi:hypothetical protein AWC25_21590 [Mycobacterium sherrisii]|nr:hypothetical protein AWC25_21590 [Mycobacterium sherrisii]